jgi:ATP-binding cassette subfamily B protein
MNEKPNLQHFEQKFQGAVNFDHVNFSYNENKKIIEDFCADITPGMKVAIVGHTGSGKTTIVNLLMRFYEINSGCIKIDGIDISEISQIELREKICMVLQDT